MSSETLAKLWELAERWKAEALPYGGEGIETLLRSHKNMMASELLTILSESPGEQAEERSVDLATLEENVRDYLAGQCVAEAGYDLEMMAHELTNRVALVLSALALSKPKSSEGTGITRWTPREVEGEEEDGPIFQGFDTDPDGQWVRWEDVAALEASPAPSMQEAPDYDWKRDAFSAGAFWANPKIHPSVVLAEVSVRFPHPIYSHSSPAAQSSAEGGLRRLQAEQVPWVKHNFGDRPSWMPLLGAVEELGELAHAHLKQAQGIRVSENHDEKARDAVADIVIYLADYCSSRGFDLETLVMETWDKVKLRDWKKDPAHADIAAQPTAQTPKGDEP